MRSHLTIVVCLIIVLLILPMFELLTTANGCLIERETRDTLEIDENRLGSCPAARNTFCGSLNAEPLIDECGCKCRNDYATFTEEANSCVRNDQVHYGCQVSSISDPLGVVYLDESLQLALKTTGYKCTLDKSFSSYRNTSSWMAFSSSSFPFKLLMHTQRIRKRRRNRRKRNRRRTRREEYSYFVELVTLPNYLRGRLVKLELNCGSQGTRCFVFKVEGPLNSNNCAPLLPVKPSTVVLEPTSLLVDNWLVRNKGTRLISTATTAPSDTLSVTTASPSTTVITQTYALSKKTAASTMTTDTIPTLLLPTGTATETKLLLSTATTSSTIITKTETPPLLSASTTLSKVQVAASLFTKLFAPTQISPSSSPSSLLSITSTMTTRTTSAFDNTGSWKGLLSTNQLLSTTEPSMFAVAKQGTNLQIPTSFSQSETSVIHPTTDISPEDIIVKKHHSGDKRSLWSLVGGVTGAVLFITVVVISLYFVKKRRTKRRPDEAGLSDHQLQEIGSPNEGYYTRPESFYSEIEGGGTSYQSLLVQNRESHDYGKLCNSKNTHSPSLAEPFYTYPETAKRKGCTKEASSDYDYATLEEKESDEKRGATQSKTDSEYCEIRQSFNPGLDGKQDSNVLYDYAEAERKKWCNRRALIGQRNRNENRPFESKDLTHYYRVLEGPDPSSNVADSSNAFLTSENQPFEPEDISNYYRVLEGPDSSSNVADSSNASLTSENQPFEPEDISNYYRVLEGPDPSSNVANSSNASLTSEKQPSEPEDISNYYRVLEGPDPSSVVTNSPSAASAAFPRSKEHRNTGAMVQNQIRTKTRHPS